VVEKSLLEGKKILIVDDEPDVLDTLEQLLNMCDLTRATTFEEARHLLETERFDIAILDIMGVEGYRLLEIAKKKETLAVMLTAHAFSPENIVRSYNEGAASYVPKEEIGDISVFLADVLEAKEKGKNFWFRWLDRLASVLEKNFGPEWQDQDKDFWERFRSYL
jgi:DNA-binding NtrC family response regulator